MVDAMAHVHLRDSWVLAIQTSSEEVCFTIDAVLERDHPRFYWPPHPGEQHAYLRLRWCLRGQVMWNEGPLLDRPAVDANGERDFGGFDTWLHEEGADLLEGDWGSVTVRDAQHAVTEIAADDTTTDDPSLLHSSPEPLLVRMEGVADDAMRLFLEWAGQDDQVRVSYTPEVILAVDGHDRRGFLHDEIYFVTIWIERGQRKYLSLLAATTDPDVWSVRPSSEEPDPEAFLSAAIENGMSVGRKPGETP